MPKPNPTPTPNQVAEAEEARRWASWEESQGRADKGSHQAPSSSLGQLLVMDYSTVKELPAHP